MSLSDTPESIIVRRPVKVSEDHDHDKSINSVTKELLEEVIEEATEDKENIASKAKTRWTMAYRAVRKGSDEEVFTPEKFQGKKFFVKLST